jgi:hypothetical protein
MPRTCAATWWGPPASGAGHLSSGVYHMARWRCIPVHGSTAPHVLGYLAVHGSTCQYMAQRMAAHGSTWQYVAAHDSAVRHTAVPKCTWLCCVRVRGGATVWRHTAARGRTWCTPCARAAALRGAVPALALMRLRGWRYACPHQRLRTNNTCLACPLWSVDWGWEVRSRQGCGGQAGQGRLLPGGWG